MRTELVQCDSVIRGGLVVTGGWQGQADVGITGDAVTSVSTPGLLTGSQEVDASGLIVVPGGVDPHVHSALVSGATVTVDDFDDVTRAALHGGTTTIVDFAFPASTGTELPRAALSRRAADADRQAWCDVALHAVAVAVTPEVLEDLSHLVTDGYPTLKVFTIYRNEFMLTLEDIRRCMEVMRGNSGVLVVHAESPHLIEPLVARAKEAVFLGPAMHASTRPPISEVDMVQSVISMAGETGCPTCFVHVSTPAGARAVAEATRNGAPVWAEACPQYVLLDDDRYRAAEGALYICSPPLRSPSSRQEQLGLLAAGSFAVWGSDHCGYTRAQKFDASDDFTAIPNGLPGVETRCPLLFSLAMDGCISLQQFVRLSAANPARLNGLYPRKGTIAPGADADIVVWDPAAKWEVSAETLHQRSDFTPYEGFGLRGAPREVFLRGQLQIQGGAERPGRPRSGTSIKALRSVVDPFTGSDVSVASGATTVV